MTTRRGASMASRGPSLDRGVATQAGSPSHSSRVMARGPAARGTSPTPIRPHFIQPSLRSQLSAGATGVSPRGGSSPRRHRSWLQPSKCHAAVDRELADVGRQDSRGRGSRVVDGDPVDRAG